MKYRRAAQWLKIQAEVGLLLSKLGIPRARGSAAEREEGGGQGGGVDPYHALCFAQRTIWPTSKIVCWVIPATRIEV